MQLGDNLQTTCLHCGSVFRITPEQLEMAHGQARCNQCHQVFNALFSLENYSRNQPSNPEDSQQSTDSKPAYDEATDSELKTLLKQPVSLTEAMYGENDAPRKNLKPLLWMVGIVVLAIVTLVQVIYYQRYSLIESTEYQQQILNLCQILPCDESRFKNLKQIKLIERNVFSHPNQGSALMISGSFMNNASFQQALPRLLISLSDLQGNLIANRLFTAQEYLTDKSLTSMNPQQAIQFKLEILDPGSEALTYEFEFVS